LIKAQSTQLVSGATRGAGEIILRVPCDREPSRLERAGRQRWTTA